MKKRMMGLSLALALCLSLAAPALAASPGAERAGDQEYNSPSTTTTTNGYTYKYWSALYVGTGFRAATYVQVINGDALPKYVQTKARLYSDAGLVLREADLKTSSVSTNLEVSTTKSYGADTAYSQGLVGFREWDGGYTTHDAPRTQTRSRAVDEELLLQWLDENGAYRVNQKGETYGSELLSGVVGAAPDLIAAVGVDGVQGYIRMEDRMPDLSTPEKLAAHEARVTQDKEIPLYDVNGAVIGTYLMEGVDLFYDMIMRQLDNGRYPVNANGETYGPEGAAEILGYKPDLVACVATNGEEGYMRNSEREYASGVNRDPEEFQAARSGKNAVPVYDKDGNVIGEFVFESGEVTPQEIQSAREYGAKG